MTDVVIVGGGIVGLAVGYALNEAYPDLALKIIEKEPTWGGHQTSHNSGVIHSGIYYAPGSLKSRLARLGNERMVRFCEQQGISHDVCGKVIVATDAEELLALDRLMERAKANGVVAHRLNRQELREREPHVEGLGALHVPSTGIVDYGEVASKLASLLALRGAELHLETKLETIERSPGEIRLGTSKGSFSTRFIINCAGLHHDRVADWDGAEGVNRVMPFRGDYFHLRADRTHLIRHLVYPVPDSRFPFLGVHLTRSIHGGVHVGPNAVLSFAREGYKKTAFNFSETSEMLRSDGFWGYARRNWKHGVNEAATGFNVRAFARRLQRLVPEIRPDDLVPSESGVRAQSITPEGHLADDFQIVTGRNSLHVCNAASPAATASLELGRYIAQKARQTEGFPVLTANVDPWLEPSQNYCEGLCEI